MVKLTIPEAIEYLGTVIDIQGCVINETWPEGTQWAGCPDCRALSVWAEQRTPHTVVGSCQKCGRWWNLIRFTLALNPTEGDAERFMAAVKLLDSELKEGE